MQTKIIDFQNKNKTKELNHRLKYLFVGIFILLISIFVTKFVFAEIQPDIDSINVVFEKNSYSLMEDTSTKIAFTIENNGPVQAKVLVWADCEEDDDDEIECNYSKQFTLSENSTTTGSFYVIARNESDTTLTVYVKLLNSDTQEINNFSIDIEVTEDAEGGDFEIDVYNYNVCIGKPNTITMEINNDLEDGLYNIFLTNPRLAISSEYSNPVFIRESKEIDYTVIVPETTEEGEAFDLQLRIENDEITVVKEITIYASDCPETNLDFTVSGPSTINYSLNKEQEKTATYTIKNNSNRMKTIYISEDHSNQEINVTQSAYQVILSAGESESVDFTFRASKDIKSGTYDVSLNFFDGVNSINKKVKLLINPNYNFQIGSSIRNSFPLVMGQNVEMSIFIKNLGDLSDEFTIIVDADNDLRVRTSESTVVANAHTTTYSSIFISAGNNTDLGNSNVSVRINGRNSGYSQILFFTVDVVRITPPINLELLSFPSELTIDANSTKDIEITLRNTGNSQLTIDRIELTNIPQEISLITESDFTLNPGQTKTITAKLVIGDIPKEDINAKLRFVSSTGGVLEKSILLKYQAGSGAQASTAKSKLLGFLTLRNSVLWGIIFICILIILLFVLGVLKQNKN